MRVENPDKALRQYIAQVLILQITSILHSSTQICINPCLSNSDFLEIGKILASPHITQNNLSNTTELTCIKTGIFATKTQVNRRRFCINTKHQKLESIFERQPQTGMPKLIHPAARTSLQESTLNTTNCIFFLQTRQKLNLF